jgi:hypothetical protein
VRKRRGVNGPGDDSTGHNVTGVIDFLAFRDTVADTLGGPVAFGYAVTDAVPGCVVLSAY